MGLLYVLMDKSTNEVVAECALRKQGLVGRGSSLAWKDPGYMTGYTLISHSTCSPEKGSGGQLWTWMLGTRKEWECIGGPGQYGSWRPPQHLLLTVTTLGTEGHFQQCLLMLSSSGPIVFL